MITDEDKARILEEERKHLEEEKERERAREILVEEDKKNRYETWTKAQKEADDRSRLANKKGCLRVAKFFGICLLLAIGFLWLLSFIPHNPPVVVSSATSNPLVVSSASSVSSTFSVSAVALSPPKAIELPRVPPDMTCYKFCSMFGARSPLTAMQKDALFTEYQGKTVKWTGTLATANVIWGKPNLAVKCLPTTLISDVNFILADSELGKVYGYLAGNQITIEGTLTSYGTLLDSTVENAHIIRKK